MDDYFEPLGNGACTHEEPMLPPPQVTSSPVLPGRTVRNTLALPDRFGDLSEREGPLGASLRASEDTVLTSAKVLASSPVKTARSNARPQPAKMCVLRSVFTNDPASGSSEAAEHDLGKPCQPAAADLPLPHYTTKEASKQEGGQQYVGSAPQGQHNIGASCRTATQSSAEEPAMAHLPMLAKEISSQPSASGPTEVDSLAQWATGNQAPTSPRPSDSGPVAHQYADSQGLWDSLVSEGDAADDDAVSTGDQGMEQLPTISEEGQGVDTWAKPLDAPGVHVFVTLAGSPGSGSSGSKGVCSTPSIQEKQVNKHGFVRSLVQKGKRLARSIKRMRFTNSPAKAATLLSNASPGSSIYAGSQMEGPLSSGAVSSVFTSHEELWFGRRSARPPAYTRQQASDPAGSLPRSQPLISQRRLGFRQDERDAPRSGRQHPARESAAGSTHRLQQHGAEVKDHAQQAAVSCSFGFHAGISAMMLDCDSPLSSFASRPSNAARRHEECNVSLSELPSAVNASKVGDPTPSGALGALKERKESLLTAKASLQRKLQKAQSGIAGLDHGHVTASKVGNSAGAEQQQLRSENARLASLRQKDQAKVAALTKELRVFQGEGQTEQVQAMQTRVSALQLQLAANLEETEMLQAQNADLRRAATLTENGATEQKALSLEAENSKLRELLLKMNAELNSKDERTEARMGEVVAKNVEMQQRCEQLAARMNSTEEVFAGLFTKAQQLTDMLEEKCAEREELLKRASMLATKLSASQEEVKGLQREVTARAFGEAELEAKVAELSALYDEAKAERKVLQNQILGLRGNIRVLCRVRPESSSELASSAKPAIVVDGKEAILLVADRVPWQRYEVDRAFTPSEGQEEVYGEVSPFIAGVVDGTNACILAYGQTGSGKTHTMTGCSKQPGVITRALSQLFWAVKEMHGSHKVAVSASVLEIYNETLRDLLSPTREEKLDIKSGHDGIYVPGLTVKEVTSAQDVAGLMATAAKSRTTSATKMNQHSSRSHLVLTVHVTTEHCTTGCVTRSKLHLVDLAGSERTGRSGAEGARMKEAQAINKSLSALGDVIQALQQKAAHVPFRNSRLTRLLEDSLSGNAKVLLILACSPCSADAQETRSTLLFGLRARSTELGPARRNVNIGEGVSAGLSPVASTQVRAPATNGPKKPQSNVVTTAAKENTNANVRGPRLPPPSRRQ